MIILLGIPSESPIAMVSAALDRLGLPYTVLNQRRFEETPIELEITCGSVGGRVVVDGQAIDCAAVTGIYTRLMDWRSLPEFDASRESTARICQSWHEVVGEWIELAPGCVMNRNGASASNLSKPYQAQLISQAGFSIPDTIVTNDPELVLEFAAHHRQVLFKSISCTRSIVQMLDDAAMERLSLIRACPVQFQRYIAGTNVRVHVVAGEVFGTRIETDRVDYRYAERDGGRATLTEEALPDELAERCVKLADHLGLAFAGIDLIVGDDGEVFCLEVNTGPAFNYYESHTGQPIAKAVATALARGGATVSGIARETGGSACTSAHVTGSGHVWAAPMVASAVEPMIDDVPVYDEVRTAEIADRVEALRDQWLRRGEAFSTLGLAAYLDVAYSENPEEDYYARCAEQNALLRQHFSDVLDDVGSALARHVGGAVRLEPTVAHPGFHIFEHRGIAISRTPSIHFDLQHRLVHWPFDVSDDSLLTFTLALKLPRLGAGLEYWKVTEQEAARLQEERGITVEQIANSTPAQLHWYSPGVMAVQTAPVMHRIAPVAETFPGDQRITLQGHAVRDGDTWVMYW